MYNIKIGDRVTVGASCCGDFGSCRHMSGLSGKVVASLDTGHLGVDFGKKYKRTHSLNGSLLGDTGLWYLREELQLLSKMRMVNK